VRLLSSCFPESSLCKNIHVDISNSSLWLRQTATVNWRLRLARCAPRTHPLRLHIITEPIRPSMVTQACPRSLFYTANYTTSDQASGSMRLVHWQKARVMMSTWKQRAAQRLNGAASGTAQVLRKTYTLKRRVWKSHDAPCASWGVCARTKCFHYSTRSYFFFLMRRRHCRCTTSASHVVRLSLSVPLFISSRLCCLSSDTDLLLFLYAPYPLALLAHDAYVNRTMTYDHDHAISSRRSTIHPLLTSTTDIILFYFSFTSSSTMMRYLSYRTYRCRFPPGGLGVCKGRAGTRCTYTFWRSYQINQSSKVLLMRKKKSKEAKLSIVSLGIKTDLKTGLGLLDTIFSLAPRFLKPFI
jgi:hypothetical protein